MDRKDVELLMGGGEGQGGVFTWREKNRRKVCSVPSNLCISSHRSIILAGVFSVRKTLFGATISELMARFIVVGLTRTVSCFLLAPHTLSNICGISVSRSDSWPWLFVFLRLVESRRHYVRMSIRVRVFIVSLPRFPSNMKPQISPIR